MLRKAHIVSANEVKYAAVVAATVVLTFLIDDNLITSAYIVTI